MRAFSDKSNTANDELCMSTQQAIAYLLLAVSIASIV